jgi:hypothetical protein
LAVFLVVFVRPRSVNELFPPDFFPVDHSFHGCSAATQFALRHAFVDVAVQPVILNSLKRIDAVLELLVEGDLAKLL